MDEVDIIGEAEDELILDAKAQPKKVRFAERIKWFGAIAAVLVLFIGIGSLLLARTGILAPKGNSNAGGSGHEEGSVFMSYAGPVFPLTLKEENSAISAQRTVTMDFKEYNISNDMLVSDTYMLINEATQEQKVRVLYPFVSSLNYLKENCPVLTLNGEPLQTELHAGSYSGQFQGAWEGGADAKENPGSLNLLDIASWEDYQALLSDGTYLERALGEAVDLSHIPVKVYTFTDAWGPEEDSDKGIPNPSIRVMFDMDYENTKVLSFGFSGHLYNKEKGIMGKEFSIRQEGERKYGIPHYLIVVGEDIENINCQGYVTGGWDTKKKIESGVTVARSESDLESILRKAAEYLYQEQMDFGNYEEAAPEYGFELYFGLLKEHLMAYGLLSEHPAERYSSGSLGELDVINVDRVFWLEAEVTIPAGQSVLLDATFKKEPSFDYYCAASENRGVNGYDMVTKLGSNIKFTKQSARLNDCGLIEIVRQNFGFVPEQGIKEVELDMEQAHYYLEVKKAKQKE